MAASFMLCAGSQPAFDAIHRRKRRYAGPLAGEVRQHPSCSSKFLALSAPSSVSFLVPKPAYRRLVLASLPPVPTLPFPFLLHLSPSRCALRAVTRQSRPRTRSLSPPGHWRHAEDWHRDRPTLVAARSPLAVIPGCAWPCPRFTSHSFHFLAIVPPPSHRHLRPSRQNAPSSSGAEQRRPVPTCRQAFGPAPARKPRQTRALARDGGTAGERWPTTSAELW